MRAAIPPGSPPTRRSSPLRCCEKRSRGHVKPSRYSPWLREQKIGAYYWGFVQGKSQTHMPWDSWKQAYVAEPPLWFHDILHPDGKPYIDSEVALLKHTLAS